MTDALPSSGGFFQGDAWRWWHARRLRYNIALALAGWLAYGADIGLFYAFDHPVWRNWQGAVGMTLFLGTLYLAMMFIANLSFLLGPLTESLVEPADLPAFRHMAWRMGLLGSVALPFLVPLANLAFLIGESGR
jgi:hypothetical protein